MEEMINNNQSSFFSHRRWKPPEDFECGRLCVSMCKLFRALFFSLLGSPLTL